MQYRYFSQGGQWTTVITNRKRLTMEFHQILKTIGMDAWSVNTLSTCKKPVKFRRWLTLFHYYQIIDCYVNFFFFSHDNGLYHYDSKIVLSVFTIYIRFNCFRTFSILYCQFKVKRYSFSCLFHSFFAFFSLLNCFKYSCI